MSTKPIVYVDVNVVVALLCEPEKLPGNVVKELLTYDLSRSYELTITRNVFELSQRIAQRVLDRKGAQRKVPESVLDVIRFRWFIANTPPVDEATLDRFSAFTRDHRNRPDIEDAHRLTEAYQLDATLFLTNDRQLRRARGLEDDNPNFSKPMLVTPRQFLDLDHEALHAAATLQTARATTSVEFALSYRAFFNTFRDKPRVHSLVTIDSEVRNFDAIISVAPEPNGIRIAPVKFGDFDLSDPGFSYRGEGIVHSNGLAAGISKVVFVMNNLCGKKNRLDENGSLLMVIDDELAVPETGDAIAALSSGAVRLYVGRADDHSFSPTELTMGSVKSQLLNRTSRSDPAAELNVGQRVPTVRAPRL